MEDNFLKDDFEQFLKGSADDFLMVPQRKVWYSIYNSMHPDRKWPSLAVCLLILSAVLFIGISNNNSISDAARKAGAENMSSIAKNRADESNTKAGQPSSRFLSNSISVNNPTLISAAAANHAEEVTTDVAQPSSVDRLPSATAENTGTILIAAAETNAGNNHPGALAASSGFNEGGKLMTLATAPAPHADNATASVNIKTASKNNAAAAPDADNDLQNVNNPVATSTTHSNDAAVAVNENKNAVHTNAAKPAILTNDQRAWIEDFAFHNRAGKSKFKRNAALSYYMTPSLGYRTIIRKSGYTPAGSLLLASRAVPSLHESLLDGAALNLEAGAAINYKVAKNIRLKAGLQFNYTNYITNGTELGHPAQTSVAIMDNEPQMLRSTTFSVDGDKDKFNHRSVQVSIPIGADIELIGNNKLKWYLGATLQPTYIIGGTSLALSSDEKNLIPENSLSRNWNLNTAVETFISYKTKSGIVFNAGPQFRYQMMSTFKKQYAYNERPYNLGIKLGFTKSF